jgi:hypothetical protein
VSALKRLFDDLIPVRHLTLGQSGVDRSTITSTMADTSDTA